MINKQTGFQRKINSALTSLTLGLITSFFNPAYADNHSVADDLPLVFSKTGELLDLIKLVSYHDYTYYVDNNFRLDQDYVVVYGELPSTFRTEKNNSAGLVIFKTYYDCKKRLYKIADIEYYQFHDKPGDVGWKLVEIYEVAGGIPFMNIPANTFMSMAADWFCHRY